MEQRILAFSIALLFCVQAAQAADGPLQNPAPVPCAPDPQRSAGADQAGISRWQELGVGEWKIVANVCPQWKYFPSGVVVRPGATYEISAVGRWRDGFLPPVGPDGWNGLLLTAANRLRWKPMFLLTASIGKQDRSLIAIGAGRRLTIPSGLGENADRRLYFFANDWNTRFTYANNRDLNPSQGGPMRVSIRRID